MQAGSTRYFVTATCDGVETEILKFEQSTRSAVIVMSGMGRITDTKSIHITHHRPKRGLPTRIMHMSDASGTDVRHALDPTVRMVELGQLIVNLGDLDWNSTKPFRRTAYRAKYVHDVAARGPHIDARFYLGDPAAISEAMSRRLSPERHEMLMLKPSGFGTPPGGHEITTVQILFDDEADETLGHVP